jgi:predicted membrane-bound spermidine synthase
MQPKPHVLTGTKCLRLDAFAFPREVAPATGSGYNLRVKKPVSAPPLPAPSISPAQRLFLFFTAGVTGAAIMVIEILGAKMLAPYVGTSHFVWTAQIAVTLVALAAGYYVGGTLADQSPNLGRLYGAIIIAAFYVCGAVFVTEPVAYACLKFKLATGSLLASAFLYFVPLGLLAMVGPYLVRVITQSLSGVGTMVGRLTAISTIGSFAGTVLIGYVLIPYFPNSVTMAVTAFLLIAISAVYFLVWPGGAGKVAALVALVTGAVAAYGVGQPKAWRGPNAIELFRGNSNFGLLQVLQVKDDERRMYLNDYLVQNIYDTNLQKSTTMFTYMLHGLARAYTTEIKDVLCIGLGIGIVPMDFAREGASVDVVEINPAVVPVGQKFFNLDPARMQIHIGDGRHFVATASKKYDAVILDAFLGDSSPGHLMTREAFAGVRRLLRPPGVLVINAFGEFESGQDFYVASMEKTLRTVFSHVRIHNERNGGNVLFVASQSELRFNPPPNFDYVHPRCRYAVEGAFARVVESIPEHGIVLTDDYNPVEFYDAANREQIRKNLAFSMREF